MFASVADRERVFFSDEDKQDYKQEALKQSVRRISSQMTKLSNIIFHTVDCDDVSGNLVHFPLIRNLHEIATIVFRKKPTLRRTVTSAFPQVTRTFPQVPKMFRAIPGMFRRKWRTFRAIPAMLQRK